MEQDNLEPRCTTYSREMYSAEVGAFLAKYYSEGGQKHGLHDPKDKIILVTVQGQTYVIADVGLRMLRPRELYLAQGFPSTYLIDIPYKGKPLSMTAQVRMCGNSVSPAMARVLVAANYEPLRQAEIA